MAYGQDNEGKPGLVFTSEQQEYDSQSILFAIPLVEQFTHTFDLINDLKHAQIYFPFLLADEYLELDAVINFPDLKFTIPDKDIQITFAIDTDNLWEWEFFPFRRLFKGAKYVGNAQKLIVKNNGFLTLLPIDLFEMDELFNEHKGVFVGLTPNFGTVDENVG
jgi:hypothetical protein